VLLNVADIKLRVAPEEFERLCQLNRDLRLELGFPQGYAQTGLVIGD
jgi:hypothetical protein